MSQEGGSTWQFSVWAGCDARGVWGSQKLLGPTGYTLLCLGGTSCGE